MAEERTENSIAWVDASGSIIADRYEIIDTLGEGGMGTAYRVLDRAKKETRALKLLIPGAGRSRFRGEFLTLLRLRHPNVVRVFDYGTTQDGREYFTMELLKGTDFIRGAQTATLAQRRKLMSGLMRGLRFIHGRGMVHADLKPSNVMVLSGVELDADSVKILDFGLAGALDDPQSGSARGSFGYAAPEAYAGRIDARSDLYSAGVILYQLLTGQKPFPGDRMEDVIRRQLRGGARDPRTVAASGIEVPDDLAELAMQLLDPEPNARYQSADEALRVVEGRQEEDTEGALHWEGAALVGRSDLLDHIDVLRGAVRDGRGAVVLLAGGPGSGRSRLLGEVKLRVQLSGERYVAGSCGAERPYQPFAEIVRALTVEYRSRYPEVFVHRGRDLARLTGVDTLSADPDGDTLTGAGPAAHSRRFALHDAVANLLVDLSQREPLVVAIDGLDDADSATRDMFAYIARTAPSGRYLLLGIGSSEEAELLADGDIEHTRLDVPPLDIEQIRELLDATFGSGTASELAEELHSATAGVPAHVEDALRALIGRGDLRRHRGRWALKKSREPVPTPEDAVAAGRRNIAALDPDMRRVLSTAAVVGRSFGFQTLSPLLKLSDKSLAEELGAASASGIVRPATRSEGGDFIFTSPGLHEAMLAALPPAELQGLALQIGMALEARAAESPSPAQMESLAQYFAVAKDSRRAYHYGMRSARHRASVHDHRGAVSFCEQVCGVLPDGDAHRPDVLEMMADHYASLNELERARDLLVEAESLVDAAATVVRLNRKIGDLEVRLGNAEAAAKRMQEVADRYGAEVGPRDRSRLLRELAMAEYHHGRFEKAAARAQEGLTLARQGGDLSLAALQRHVLGLCAREQGRLNDAIAHFEAAVEDAERGSSEGAAAQALAGLGAAYSRRGDQDRAIASMERAERIFEGIGDLPNAVRISNNLGGAYYARGRWDLASAAWERALEMVERSGSHDDLLLILGNLAHLYRVRGKLRESLTAVDRALRIAERSAAPDVAARLLAQRAATLSERGASAEAEEAFDKATAESKRLGARGLHMQILAHRAEHSARIGDLEQAHRLAEEGLRLALAAGSGAEEAMLRRTLASVARQRELLDEAGKHLKEAQELSRKQGARFENGLCDLELAELCLARGHTELAEKATERATEAFAELGAGLHLQHARGLRDRIASQVRARSIPSHWMGTLLEVTRAIGQTFDLEDILETVLDKALETTHGERGFLILLDDLGRPQTRKVRAREEDQFGPGELSWSNTVVGEVIRTGRPLTVVDTIGDERFEAQQSIADLGLRSAMCVPMWRMGRMMGILYVDSRAVVATGADQEIAFLEALAGQAAVAIENARLFAEERQRADVIAMLAHEINNPLGAIIGFTDLIEHTSSRDPDRTLKYVGIVREQSLRLMRLLRNVMAYAKLDSDRASWTMADVAVGELLRAAMTAMAPLAQTTDVSFRLDIPEDLPPAHGNADRLTQVVTNLVSNAIKFSPKGTTVVVRATREEITTVPEPADSWFGAQKKPTGRTHCIRIEVLDEGPGIPPEQAAAIFGKFVQVDAPGARSRGVGLGLYIVRKIIQQHKGEVWAEAGPDGIGTCMCVRVPVVHA